MRRLVEQQKEIDELLTRVERLRARRRDRVRDGDRIDYAFVDSITFSERDNAAQNIVFTVPQETDYVAERLSFYPSYRFVTTDEAANGPDEIPFRPCVFSGYEGAMLNSFELDSVAGIVDCVVDISEDYRLGSKTKSRRYQNISTPVSMFYSGAINYRQGFSVGGVLSADVRYDGFEFASTMPFPCPYLLAGGSSLTIRIAPILAAQRLPTTGPNADPTQQNEYRVTAVLEGFKKVWK